MAISDSWLKAANGKVSDAPYEKTDRDGLSVRVSAKGKITFQLRYRYAGKMQRCSIGSYPLMGLKQARQECERYRSALEQGDDPRHVRMVEMHNKENADTVADLFAKWHTTEAVKKNKQASTLYRSVEKHILPKLGKMPPDKVTLHHWLNVLEPIAAKYPTMAGRLLSQSKSMLAWAVRRRLIEQNPLVDIEAARDLHVERKARDRVLSDDEIRLIFEYIDNSELAEPKNLLFVKLCLLYGCRNGELRKAKKADFDLVKKIWSIPPENRKRKDAQRPLLRPIPPEFIPDIELLMGLSAGEYLIPLRGKDEALTSNASISLPTKMMNWVKRHHNKQMEHWTLHDLRRTARTHFSTLTEPHIAEIMLDHKLPGVWQVYDKHDYLGEQMQAYQAWHRKLMIIAGKADADNVVAIKTPALAKG